MSIGGGQSKQSSSSSNQSTNYGSDIWGAQSPYLQDLFAKAQQMNLSGNQGGAGQYLKSAGQGLDASNAALKGFLNPQMDPSVGAYATNLGQQFNEQFLPGLKGDAAVAGQLGGSRQQIGAALGSQRAMQTLGDFTAQVYSGQQDRALAAAGQLGQNAQSYLGVSDFARSMPWYSLNQYAGLLGNPIMRDLGGTSSGTSRGKGSSWNANAGLS